MRLLGCRLLGIRGELDDLRKLIGHPSRASLGEAGRQLRSKFQALELHNAVAHERSIAHPDHMRLQVGHPRRGAIQARDNDPVSAYPECQAHRNVRVVIKVAIGDMRGGFGGRVNEDDLIAAGGGEAAT